VVKNEGESERPEALCHPTGFGSHENPEMACTRYNQQALGGYSGSCSSKEVGDFANFGALLIALKCQPPCVSKSVKCFISIPRASIRTCKPAVDNEMRHVKDKNRFNVNVRNNEL
jgi:hypothetical protein